MEIKGHGVYYTDEKVSYNEKIQQLFFLGGGGRGGGEIDIGTIRHEAEMDSLQDGAQLSGFDHHGQGG